MRGRRNILTGTVMMRTNGKASDATVDMTAQRTARQTTCIAVNRCIRRVRTWGFSQDTQYKSLLPSVLLVTTIKMSVSNAITAVCYCHSSFLREQWPKILFINKQKTDWSPDLAHIGVIRVVFRGHQQQQDPFCHLDSIQWHHTHVQEDAKQHSDRDLTEQITDYYWETYSQQIIFSSFNTYSNPYNSHFTLI